MTEQARLRDPESAGSSRPAAGGAWEEVLELMSGLRDSVVRWSTAAADGPITQQQLDQVRTGLTGIGRNADAAFGRGASSDLGHEADEVAEQAGKVMWGTAQQAGEAAGPYVSIVFAGLSDIFGKVAERVDGAVSAQQAASTEVARLAARAKAPNPSEGGAPTPGDERPVGA